MSPTLHINGGLISNLLMPLKLVRTFLAYMHTHTHTHAYIYILRTQYINFLHALLYVAPHLRRRRSGTANPRQKQTRDRKIRKNL